MKQGRSTSRDRRQRVLVAALDFFCESDMDAVSIADICNRSGASVGSIYHHFGNKEGIVLALLADGLEAHLGMLEKALGLAGSDPEACVEAVIGSLIDWVETHPKWASFIYANLNRSGARAEASIISVNERYTQLIEHSFGPLVEAGQIRAIPKTCWASLILAPMHDYARKWLRQQIPLSPAAEREIFIDAAWRILRPD